MLSDGFGVRNCQAPKWFSDFFSVSYYLCVGKTNHGQPRKGWFTELLWGVKLTLIWTQNDPHDSHSRNFRWIRYLLEHV